MKLTNENYYSREADEYYVSASQYKAFEGCLGFAGCERKALMTLRREWEEKTSTPMLVGSYVDAYFEGTLDGWKKEHFKDIYTNTSIKAFNKSGKAEDLSLLADFSVAEDCIKRIEKDEMFKYYLSGEKQVIMTGEIEDIPFKIKIDSLLPDAIVDLKCMSDIHSNKWIQDIGEYLDFVRTWGYDIQGAAYQEIVRQNIGKKLPFIIAAVEKSKEGYPDIILIEVDQVFLDEAMARLRADIGRVDAIKKGLIEPTECGKCNCCHTNRILLEPIKLSQLLNQK